MDFSRSQSIPSCVSDNMLKNQLENICIKYDTWKSMHYLSAKISHAWKITLALNDPSLTMLETQADDKLQFSNLQKKSQLFLLNAFKYNFLCLTCPHCDYYFTWTEILYRIGYYESVDLIEHLSLAEHNEVFNEVLPPLPHDPIHEDK